MQGNKKCMPWAILFQSEIKNNVPATFFIYKVTRAKKSLNNVIFKELCCFNIIARITIGYFTCVRQFLFLTRKEQFLNIHVCEVPTS